MTRNTPVLFDPSKCVIDSYHSQCQLDIAVLNFRTSTLRRALSITPDKVKASTHVDAGSHRLHSREPSLGSSRSTDSALDKIAERAGVVSIPTGLTYGTLHLRR